MDSMDLLDSWTEMQRGGIRCNLRRSKYMKVVEIVLDEGFGEGVELWDSEAGGDGMRKWFLVVMMVAMVLPAAAAKRSGAKGFDRTADAALAAMRAKAEGMGIGGVAVVAYFEGETIQSWSSKMVVVGRYKDAPTATDKGSNLLGIAYAKAAEMADTLKDSGSGVRPPMTGEFGWNGGVIGRVEGGYWIVAFSGGKSADDVAISRVGLARATGGEPAR